MKLEYQVCSLESAEKLKELRVKQESVFYYRLDGSIGMGFNSDVIDGKMVWNVSAFTVAELGKMLPDQYISTQVRNSYYCWELYKSPQHIVNGDTEANARAKMLIYILENK